MTPSVPDSYETSRARFRARLSTVRQGWPDAILVTHSLLSSEDLTIDIIQAPARGSKERLLVISTGEHGIEGYIGSALMELLFEEYLARLDPATTGLLLVHAINPYGMKHWKRNNPNNVDLNRNFLGRDVDENNQAFQAVQGFNADYPALSAFFNPPRPLNNLLAENLLFFARTVASLAHYGVRRTREAALMGQYIDPRGIYYGGQSLQPETRLMMSTYRSAFAGYRQIIHFDMHTGYGPRRQMTVVTSPPEKRSAAELERAYHFGRVAATNPDELYSIQGDMIEWEYLLVQRQSLDTKFFGAACEFGTFGDALPAAIRSLRSTVFENQANMRGASPASRSWMDREYREHFCPADPAWLEKALDDARQAMIGIFTAEGWINSLTSPSG